MMRPATLQELTEIISASATRAHPLRVVGRGTWLDGGAPVRADAEQVHVDAFGGIIEYEPGDLTITVGAATTIAELDAVTAPHHQWCPLSPWGGDAGSVGATIATASAGPYSRVLGLPRDLVLGLECVDGTGKVLRPGGKVVKNVAGFDLTRLMTGAWGTLGVITRASLRLRAKPAVDETWAVPLDADDASLPERMDAFSRGRTPPIACETIDAPLASRLGLDARTHLLVRLGGNAAFVAAARAAVATLGHAVIADERLWLTLREAPRAVAIRPAMPTGVRALNDRVRNAFDPASILNPGIMG
jgi:glycolate oxidase FAD binding subunit